MELLLDSIRSLFLVIIFSLIFLNGCNGQGHFKEIAIKPNIEWINDSLGCKGYRQNFSEFDEKKNKFIGIKKKDFLKIFGEPNSCSGETLNYILNLESPFCELVDSLKITRHNLGKDVAASHLVIFIFSDDTLKQIVWSIN